MNTTTTIDLDRLEALADELRKLRMFHNGHFEVVRKFATDVTELIQLARRSNAGEAAAELPLPSMIHNLTGEKFWNEKAVRAALATQQAAREQQELVAWKVPDERAAFDAWLAEGNACGANHSLWKGWQARAALASPAAPVAQQSEAGTDTDVLFALLDSLLGAHQAAVNVAYCPSSDPFKAAQARFRDCYNTMKKVFEVIAAGRSQPTEAGAQPERWHWSARGMELDPNGHYVAYEAGAPTASAEQGNVTMPKSVWESWQQWGNAWFTVCAALHKAWPSWNLGKENAIDSACNIIAQLAKWENERRAAPTSGLESAAPAAPVREGDREQDAKDAARYRFLREHWVSFSAAPPLSNLHWKGDKLDAKVDAAILGGGAHG